MNNVFSFAAASLLMATALSVPATYAQDVQAQQIPAQAKQARNVILFLADAGGVSAVHAASLLGYGEPLKLRIQKWPHLGLSETSPEIGRAHDLTPVTTAHIVCRLLLG